MEIRTSNEAFDRTVTLLARANQDLQSMLVQLNETVRVLREDWTGAANDAYTDAQQRWSRNMAIMTEQVARASKALADIQTNYNAASKDVENLWS
ncbi:hypothetical protein CW368_12240 [Actinomycetales bacterium SN12]|nr:hypothetical protein CW368_12240 [Actinomycetales bacterium SN12]